MKTTLTGEKNILLLQSVKGHQAQNVLLIKGGDLQIGKIALLTTMTNTVDILLDVIRGPLIMITPLMIGVLWTEIALTGIIDILMNMTDGLLVGIACQTTRQEPSYLRPLHLNPRVPISDCLDITC